MNAFRATINRGLVQGHVSFLTSFFVRALPTVSLPNHHVPQRNHLVPPSPLPLPKHQGTRNNGGRYSTLGTIVTASIFAAGVNLGAPDADSTLCMAKKLKHSKDAQASGAKGGKRGKGALVLDLSDPADEALDLVSD